MNLPKARRLLLLGFSVTLSCFSALHYSATADPFHHGHHGRSEKYQRTLKSYTLPDVTLLNQDGEKVRLKQLIHSGNPVLLDFIFTTCTTICPVLSVSFASFQQKMSQEANQATLISISIDPDHDSPPVLKEYLRRYGAKPGWVSLTGSHETIARVMKAFDAYANNKMDHYPLIFLYAPGADKWIRITGLIGTSDLVDEFHKLPTS